MLHCKKYGMTFCKLSVAFLICFFSIDTIAQNANTLKQKKHRFAVYGGFGPNYYFNNLVIGKNQVNEFNYSFAGRFMWEPEHFLSLGIESGYYRLYTLKASSPTDGTAHIINSAVPIQVVISMRFLDNFYCNFSMGQTILFNHATSSNYGDFSATSWSFADIGAALGYRYYVSKRISVSAEAKFFYSTHLDDKNLALVFMAGYKF